ncbi:MAG: hypothetical protein KJZ93_19800 [Caldilineaceae bacterium]|nr:hypothetical protein [Caldilineaceae bacterium]
MLPTMNLMLAHEMSQAHQLEMRRAARQEHLLKSAQLASPNRALARWLRWRRPSLPDKEGRGRLLPAVG